MKIVIAGAGSIGYHLAKLLSKENQDITLIDQDENVLEQIASKLDVMTLCGNASSVNILKSANVSQADLFISVTTSESTNLLTAILAKQKGAKKTIARVNNTEFLKKEQREYFAKIGIDQIISPQNLAAQEINRLVKRASLTDIFDFENGKISTVGFTIDASSRLIGKAISEIDNTGFDYRGVALLRNHTTFIPRGRTILQKGDHLYLSINTKHIDKVMPFLGMQSRVIKKIMIVGDTPLALQCALLLQKNYDVKVVMQNENKARFFLNSLDKTLIIIGDPGNRELLEQEGLAQMDAFIALTKNSEINILSNLIAKDAGVYKSIALVNNEVYTHISQNIGVDTIINKKLIAANNIFRFVRKGIIEAIATLHGVNAEIIEFEISNNCKVISKSLFDLNLPDSCIIAGVIRNKQSIIPGGDFCIKAKDKVIVFALPEAINQVESILA